MQQQTTARAAASARATGRERWFGGALGGTVGLNQSLLAIVIVLGLAIELALGQLVTDGVFAAGVACALVATLAAVAIPWSRVPTWVSAFLPLFDIVAIALLRQSSPASGFGLLWIFPAMWAAWAFGLVGAIASSALIALIYWAFLASTVLSGDGTLAASTLLLPLTVAAAAVVTALMAARGRRQNRLLAEQSHELQEALGRAETQERLVTEVLDAVDFGVERIALDGSATLTNPAQRRQHAAEQASARRFARDGATEFPEGEDPVTRARRGELIERELVWYGAPGEERRAVEVTSRRLGADGDAELVIVSQDVTEQELALRAREDLVASVSHELRTPLTSIIGYIDLASDVPALPDPARRSLDVANRNAERLLDLISDILADGSSNRTGVQIRVAPEPVDVAELVAAAAEAATPRAAEVGMTIDQQGIHPAPTEADPRRLRQVLDNLLSNAVKYGRHGGRIELSCGIDRGTVRIAVRDDGPGIPAHELGSVFDRFFRSSLVRGGTMHGNGLGLSISRDIVRAHGGEISVESTEGRGTLFVVRLPLVQRLTR
ncbi:MAG: HAMP domain-containing histidine kinase [Microbacteriaceae bacterium]|nr:HAMP domain-containing histidine kinase [Microbacteriaceae bacterium]